MPWVFILSETIELKGVISNTEFNTNEVPLNFLKYPCNSSLRHVPFNIFSEAFSETGYTTLFRQINIKQ